MKGGYLVIDLNNKNFKSGEGMVVEGIYSAKAAYKLSVKYNVSMPIIEGVNQVLFEDKPVKEIVNQLMARDKKSEYVDSGWEE